MKENIMYTFDEYLKTYSPASNANKRLVSITEYLQQTEGMIHLFEYLHEPRDNDIKFDKDIISAICLYLFNSNRSEYFSGHEDKDVVDKLSGQIQLFIDLLEQNGFALKRHGFSSLLIHRRNNYEY